MSVDRRGLATALVGGFLVIGTQSGVREAIDAASGAKGTGSLAGDAKGERGPRRPPRQAPRRRLSVRRRASRSSSPARAGRWPRSRTVINPDASEGAAVALVADDDGLELAVRSELAPRRAKRHPGFFSAFPSFEPDLAGCLAR